MYCLFDDTVAAARYVFLNSILGSEKRTGRDVEGDVAVYFVLILSHFNQNKI